MRNKMKSSVFKIFIVTLLGSILCVQGENVLNKIPIKDEELCVPLRYKNPNVADKPDLLIVEASLRPKIDEFPPYPFIGVCRIRKSEDRPKLVERLDFESSREFQYDSRTDTIYVGTYSYKLQTVSNGKRQDVYEYDDDVFVDSGDGYVISYALDWVTQNLYVAHWKNVQVYNLNDNAKSPKTIISSIARSDYTPEIGVYPNEGYIIVKTDQKIVRYNQNGTNSHVLYEESDGFTICKMALDYYEQKIYWFESHRWSRESRIRYINLNGESGVVTLKSRKMHYGTCNQQIFQIDEKYVYFTEGKSDEQRLVRANKVDGKIDDDFELLENSDPNSELVGHFYNVQVLNSNPQVVLKDHPCRYDNGGCKGFCVAVPDGNKKLIKQCIDTEISSLKQAWNKVKDFFG